ncbi:MAG: 6-carboxytetrahydropterin synthase QueD [Candidatus Altiarchaeota archaeon]|nr:6-carboxytetrahydropterin synthase QueD [Candidatus Altiarchaeota archaeon]
MRVGRVFYFDAAHYLPRYKGKCEHLHGHTYRLEVVVEDELGEDGMVLDFNELKRVVDEVIIERLDHANMNDFFDKPTSENIAEWIFSELVKRLPLSSVKLWEGDGKWVEVER